MEAAPTGSLREKLQQAVYGFGQLAGCVCQGALVQVWLPVLNASTGTCDDLQTKGQPWSISGLQDTQLCLFRADCSEVTISAANDNASCETVRGALQRREVSVYADVCALPAENYSRAAKATKLGVHGSMLVPLFPHKDLSLAGPVAVLELLQLGADVTCFPALFNWLLEKLPMLNLHIPREIAHWHDAAGLDVMAKAQLGADTGPSTSATAAGSQQEQPATAHTPGSSTPASPISIIPQRPKVSSDEDRPGSAKSASLENAQPPPHGSAGAGPAQPSGRGNTPAARRAHTEQRLSGMEQAQMLQQEAEGAGQARASGRGNAGSGMNRAEQQEAQQTRRQSRHGEQRQSEMLDDARMSEEWALLGSEGAGQPRASGRGNTPSGVSGHAEQRQGVLQRSHASEQGAQEAAPAAAGPARGRATRGARVCDVGAESPAGSGERPRTSAPRQKGERSKAGVDSAAAEERPFSPGSLVSVGTLGNSHVSEAEHQAHDLASARGEQPDLAPETHHRRAPLAADIGEDSGESSGRALQLSFAELKAHFGVPLTEAATRLGVQRQDLVRSCREHNLEGWPRLSLSVNDAARSEGVPVSISSLPSDVDAAEMAAFVPFGPKAHRTTPASSWRTNSVHTMPLRQGEAGGPGWQLGGRSRRAKAAAAACHSANAGGDALMFEPEMDPVGSPQEEGESNNWVGYAKGLMLPVRSPRETRMHGEGLDEAAAQLPLSGDADAEQRQPQSSCWQKDNDPFGDTRWENWERLRWSQGADSAGRQPPPPGDVPPSGSTFTGTSLAQCLGFTREHGISTADIVEAAAMIGMAPLAPDQAPACMGSPPPITSGQPRALQQSTIDTLWELNSMEPGPQRQVLPSQQEQVMSTPQSGLLPPSQPTQSETCRRALLGDLDTAAERAAAQAQMGSLSGPSEDVRRAIHQGICARERAPFSSGCTTAAATGGPHDEGTPTAQPSASGTTISDCAVGARGAADASETADSGESREQSLPSWSRAAGKGKKKKALGAKRGGRGRGRGRGHGRRKRGDGGNRSLAVATADAGCGPRLFRGGGRPRLRLRIKGPSAERGSPPPPPPQQEQNTSPAELPAQPVEDLHAAQSSEQPESAAAEQPSVQQEVAAAAQPLAAAEVAAPCRPLLPPAEPAVSEPLPPHKAIGIVPVSVPPRSTQSVPLPCTPPLDNDEEVTSAEVTSAEVASAPSSADTAQNAPEPCSTASLSQEENAPTDASPETHAASAPPMLAAAATAQTGSPEKAAAATATEECSGQRQDTASGRDAQTAAPRAKEAAAAAKPRMQKRLTLAPAPAVAGRQRWAGGGSRGSSGEARGGPKKRGRPPHMVPHPHTGQLVPKRDLIAARIDPLTGECRSGKKRKAKAAAAAAAKNSSPENPAAEEAPFAVLGRKRKAKAAAAAPAKEASPEIPAAEEAPFAVPSRSDKQKRPVKKSRRVIEAEEAQQDLGSSPEPEAPAHDETAAAADAAGDDDRHSQSDGEAEVERVPKRKQFKLQALLADCPAGHHPETPTRGTSALVYMSTPTSRPRNALLASPTARKFPAATEQEITCDEQLPERLPEPSEAALQGFLVDALNFSPPRPLSGVPPFGGGVPPFSGGGSLFGGGGGSVSESPLPRLHDADQMFYGCPLGDLGTAAFTDLAESSFSFGCFT